MAHITATPQEVADWITTGFEGGINYWCDDAHYLDKELQEELSEGERGPVYALGEYWERGGRMQIFDREDDTVSFVIDYASVVDTLSKDCISNKLFAALKDGCQYDADDADALIQCVGFGEVIYG
jgi:hypothetical protein